MAARGTSAAAANAENPLLPSAASTQTRIRPRDDDQAEEEKQTARSSAHVSPAMRLYRHALESIFAMLNLHDLTQILAVGRSWSAAVRSMKAIGARVHRDSAALRWGDRTRRPLPPIHALIASPLLRHVAAIEIKGSSGQEYTALTSESLALLMQHAPHLTSLCCNLTLTPAPAPLILPAALASLELRLPGKPSAAEVHRVLHTLAAMPVLQRLLLSSHADSAVDWSLLSASRSLRDLSLHSLERTYSDFSNAQVAQIRSGLGHLQRLTFDQLRSVWLTQLVQQPVTARWQDIGFIWADARTGDLLVTLPTLTSLDLWFNNPAPHANFLSQLPLLTALKLNCNINGFFGPRTWAIPAAPLLASLLPCTGLTELSLRCGFNSVQLTALFAMLTSLTKLTIDGDLESLQCFASGPITQTLKDLTLRDLYLPPSELVHLYSLCGLRALDFDHCFDPPLDEATIIKLSPPTQLLPMLTRFVCKWKIEDGDEWDCAERKGLSFAWTQKRLAQ